MTTPAYALRDGNSIPAIGLGTFASTTRRGTRRSRRRGRRLPAIDTAYNYGNEGRRRGDRRTGVTAATCSSPPSSPVGTTDSTRRSSFEQSRMKLGLE